jgi:hypothetical protein
VRILCFICMLGFMPACGSRDSGTSTKPSIKDANNDITSEIEVPERQISSIHPLGSAQSTIIEVSGYSLNIAFDDSKITWVELPQTIYGTLQIRLFERMLTIYSLERLREICVEMNYRQQRTQVITRINGAIHLNPFTEKSIRNAFSRKMLRSNVESVPGSMVPANIRLEIAAPFLQEQELAKLQSRLNHELHSNEEYLAFDLHGDLNHLENPSLLEPIMEFSRLICGILNNEASLSFILTDQDGRVLTTKVDKVEFSH